MKQHLHSRYHCESCQLEHNTAYNFKLRNASTQVYNDFSTKMVLARAADTEHVALRRFLSTKLWGSGPEQCIENLWCGKWQWAGLVYEHFGFTLSAQLQNTLHSFIHCHPHYVSLADVSVRI